MDAPRRQEEAAGEGGVLETPPLLGGMGTESLKRTRRFERAPWRQPQGTHEVVEFLFRNHFDEVVRKLGRHPYTQGTSSSYREELAMEVLRRMLESGQLDHYTPGAVGAWITQSVFRHRNETDKAEKRLTVTEGDLRTPPTTTDGAGLNGFAGSEALEPEVALDGKQRELAGLELRTRLSEELQQLYQLRWEQGLRPGEIRSHFGWSVKQYEKRDAKLKSLVLAVVRSSAPDSLVDGFGDGSVCDKTRDLLPLLFRQGERMSRDDRLHLDAHLLACDSCRVAARGARTVLDSARPLFVPVGPPVVGGAVAGGGVVAEVWAKIVATLGFGGGGAAATKVVGVAGCVAACIAGGQALTSKDMPSRAPAARETEAERPSSNPSVQIPRVPAVVVPTRTTAAKPNAASPGTRTTRRKTRAAPRKKAAKKKPVTKSTAPAPARIDTKPKAPEFIPEGPAPAAVRPAPAPAAAAAPSAAPAGGAEFAGP